MEIEYSAKDRIEVVRARARGCTETCDEALYIHPASNTSLKLQSSLGMNKATTDKKLLRYLATEGVQRLLHIVQVRIFGYRIGLNSC